MTKAERDLKSFLDKTQKMPTRSWGEDYIYDGPFDALARHGRMWPVAADQSPGETVVSVPKACFDNAYRLARRSKLRYVEGYALGVIPVEHAWVVNEQNEVIDPTWHMQRSSLGTAYYGVVIPLKLMVKSRRRGCSSGLFDWMHRFPLLKHQLGER